MLLINMKHGCSRKVIYILTYVPVIHAYRDAIFVDVKLPYLDMLLILAHQGVRRGDIDNHLLGGSYLASANSIWRRIDLPSHKHTTEVLKQKSLP